MTISSQDKEAVTDEVNRLIHIANHYFDRTFPQPAVTFRRSGKNAGTAFLQQNRVNFHPILFVENKTAFFDEVIPHEVSHLLTYQLFGRKKRVKPHGIEWQAVMRDVYGVSPSTTHSFDLTSLKIKSFQYRCGCDRIALSVRRHNNVLKGMTYRCRRCNEILQYDEV